MKYYRLALLDKEAGEWVDIVVRTDGNIWQDYEWETQEWITLDPAEYGDYIKKLEQGGFVKDSLDWEMTKTPFTMEEVTMNETDKLIGRVWIDLIDNGSLFEAVTAQLGDMDGTDEQFEKAQEVIEEMRTRLMNGQDPLLTELQTEEEE